MTQLPEEFIRNTRETMGEERFQRYLDSFQQDIPVSIRLNPQKMESGKWQVEGGEPVPWCRNAFYLKQRPNFTMDPLLHAGCYYVQEAASMFLDEILRTSPNLPKGEGPCSPETSPTPSEGGEYGSSPSGRLGGVLDLCAAPGGKSTLLRAALPPDCVLYSNEPVRNRASILAENVTKWGYANHIVTNNYPEAYRKSKLCFDLILCDVPCSGEGMFRKDEATIREWSPQQVEKCWRLQREIVSDAWACLNPDGLIIYSTCTFNTKENEENIRWILSEFDAEVVPVAVQPEWHITGSLLPGFTEPVYRFIPGISRGEGLFMCVLRKKGGTNVFGGTEVRGYGGTKYDYRQVNSLSILVPPHPRTPVPPTIDIPTIDLPYQQAIAYLRGEALVLPPDTPCGLVTVAFMGHPLGQAKNIGTRANNLYPKEWRIKTTHVPQEYEPIIHQVSK